MSDIEIVHDGVEERRLGLLLPPQGMVMATPVYEESAYPILDDSDITKLITDPNRTPRRQVFDEHWIVEGDQGTHGSCNGWAGASVLSKTRWLRGLRDGLVLSGAYVYSKINGHRDSGSGLDQGMAELTNGGAPPASLVNKNMIYPELYAGVTPNPDQEATKHKGGQLYHCSTKQGFRSGIALGFLGVVAVQVAGGFQSFRGTGIMPAWGGQGNHAVHVDDMMMFNGTEVFDLVNNWNVTWGDRGRAKVTWDSFAQTFPIHSFYLIPTTTEAGE